MNVQNIQIEVDASHMYKFLADKESDVQVAHILREMSDIEYSHAVAFMEKNGIDLAKMPLPSFKTKVLKVIGKVLGYDYVLGILMDTEKSLSNTILEARKTTQTPRAVTDTAHVAILRNILNNNQKVSGSVFNKFEKRHRSVGGNALRAAVVGGNDGLVSNFSLIMGVAGASSEHAGVLLAGFAGLLAGALSMALGEWISVKSSQELYENQMQLEMDELESNPEGEEKELKLIFLSKGVPEEQAKQMAKDAISNIDHAHQILVKEELGINAEDLEGSAMEAAIFSFLLFALGAIIPLIPFMFTGGNLAIILSVLFSGIGLFFIGASITLFTNKNVWYSGFRQVLFGLMAAAITFGIGKFIGISIAG